MNRIYNISLLVIALGISIAIFIACKRTTKDQEPRPAVIVIPAPSDFTGIKGGGDLVTVRYVYASPPTPPPPTPTTPATVVNLGKGDKIEFKTDTFSHTVTWNVKITGSISGAVKNYNGTSNKLDSNYVMWDGAADDTSRFFVQGETISFILSFMNSSITYGSSFLLNTNMTSGPKKYSSSSKLLPDGSLYRTIMVDNWDLNIPSPIPGIRTSYSDLADGNQKAVFYITDKVQRDGYFSYYMTGTDLNGNSYCGGSSGEALTEMRGKIGVDDPEKVFVNAYIYGYGRPNTSILFQSFENDFFNPDTGVGPDRNAATSDMWYAIVQVTWTGWQLVSVPYSAFKPANDPRAGGGGNRIREPRKMFGFGIELDSYPLPSFTVEAAIDDVIITENGAFKP